MIQKEGKQRPFVPLVDIVRAHGAVVQAYHEQAANVSAIAYLLFSVARPLALAGGEHVCVRRAGTVD